MAQVYYPIMKPTFSQTSEENFKYKIYTAKHKN